ncbi:hypothetical protein AOC36_02505 [Erysipelothrix larvae]|uniref:Thioredoxin domain-containing protein n=1 Tax=Erysipelothrix larvae TaxID=1514105 RepID=A0A109UGL7_9FIRM|nr:hypothetical protein [Erysipelothrix larvae]AMC92893.1 hypothetical protein AOC36_02505 [Erysipelothrix larvae]
MKTRHRLGLLLLIFGMFVLASCSKEVDEPVVDTIAEAFSAFNGTKSTNGKTYIDVNLPEDHVFKTASSEDILGLLRSGTGVVYFGFPECPWCRASIRVADDAAKAVNLDSIYFVDVLDERDTQEKNEAGEIVTTEEGTQFYKDLLDVLRDWAPEYSGLDDPTIRRIHTPLVVVVVNGELVASHVGTVASQTDPFVPMTQDIYNELLEVYQDMFSLIPGCGEGANVC